MANEIEDHVSRCSTCQEYQNLPQREPLLPRCIPSRPWQIVGKDLFWWNGVNYLLLVDNYSNVFDICLLSTIKSAMVVQHTKSTFARHGIPEVVISDNGPQYSCQDYKHFASKWGFQLKTSSPVYPQSNGLAERTVQTDLLQKAKASGEDPYLSLLSYRNTPVSDAGSPAQLLMNRRLRTDLPTTNLVPKAFV
jgi:transposase InsO family protein